MKTRKNLIEEHLELHGPAKNDLAFWIEHVVHWHLLLVAVIGVIVTGVVLTTR